MMFDLARMASLLRAALAGFFVWSALGLVIWGGLIPRIARRVELPIDWALIEESGAISAGLLNEININSLDPENLAIIAGLSTAREDVDGPLLNKLTDNDRQWAIFGGSGGMITSLEKLLWPLELSGVEPGTVVLAIHPSHLIDRPATAVGLRENPFARLRRRWTDTTAVEALQSFDNYLARVRSWLYYSLYLTKVETHTFFGTAYTDYSRPADPWAAKKYRYSAEFSSPALKRIQFVRWHQYGWDNAGAYAGDGKETASFQRLLRRFDSQGAELIILLLPESREFRALIPQKVALAYLQKQLRTSRIENIRFIDLRDSMAAKYFYDTVHLNRSGRAALTALLADELASRAVD